MRFAVHVAQLKAGNQQSLTSFLVNGTRNRPCDDYRTCNCQIDLWVGLDASATSSIKESTSRPEANNLMARRASLRRWSRRCFQFSNGFTVANGVKRNLRGRPSTFLLKASKRSAQSRILRQSDPDRSCLHVPVTHPPDTAHRGIVGEFGAVKITGRVILLGPGRKRSIQPKCALTRLRGKARRASPSHPLTPAHKEHRDTFCFHLTSPCVNAISRSST